MIRTLQKKFVITAMIAITVLILLLLGAINIINIVIAGGQADRTLQMISETGGFSPPQVTVPEPPPGFSVGPAKNAYDTFISSNFFVVRFDSSGNVIDTDVSRTSSITEEEAEEMAAAVCGKEAESGREGWFRYLIREDRMGGKFVVFLDTSNDILSYLRVLFLSAAIGAVCWILMLVFVILLSRKAISPIAENIEKQKQFVTNAGHEIKTPLAIIQSNTEAMELYNGENKWTKNIKEQTTRLGGLMQNLLMLSRMEESAAGIPPTDFSLSELLNRMVQGFIQPMEAKQITLQAEIQPGITLRADKACMEQLLSILLDNAVKYGCTGGNIRVSLQRADKRVKLQVQNSCKTLPAVPPDKLFDRFYRTDSARTQKTGGYGIGLSVACSIVEAHKGTIRGEYMQPDQICFTVCL